MEHRDRVHVLRLGKFLFAGYKIIEDDAIPYLTNNLFDAQFHHDFNEVKKWPTEYGGTILQIDIKSHPVG